MRHRFLGEAALTGHPFAVLSEDFALQNLDSGDCCRYRRPLPLSQAQKHVDAVAMETPPTFAVWCMAMAATIYPPRPL